MKRWQADCLLGLAGFIWGFGFVAQKDAMHAVEPATFLACKFLIATLFVLPFAWREIRRDGLVYLRTGNKNKRRIAALCLAMTGAVVSQQYGLLATSVTKAAFITGMYIVIVPFAGWALYRQKISVIAVIACLLSLIGTALLTGGNATTLLGGFTWGDGLVFVCAICFALQVPMLGHCLGRTKAPFTLSLLQYLASGLAGLVLALLFEHISWQALCDAAVPILYSGILAAGVAYTLQAIGQQHTPATDSAILMSSETLFGAVGGAWLMHDRLDRAGYCGGAVIMLAVLMVELLPLLKKRRRT